MTTRLDEGPEFEPDDPLAVILRPPAGCLGPPPGRYEDVRRAAYRRRLLRTAAGAAVTCAVAALIALPLHLTTAEPPRSPAIPLAPPTSGRTTFPATPSPVPAASASPTPTRPGPATKRPTGRSLTAIPGSPVSRARTPADPGAQAARPLPTTASRP